MLCVISDVLGLVLVGRLITRRWTGSVVITLAVARHWYGSTRAAGGAWLMWYWLIFLQFFKLCLKNHRPLLSVIVPKHVLLSRNTILKPLLTYATIYLWLQDIHAVHSPKDCIEIFNICHRSYKILIRKWNQTLPSLWENIYSFGLVLK